jgi:hypothetical protein
VKRLRRDWARFSKYFMVYKVDESRKRRGLLVELR